jgi:hypothetical protein
MSETEERKRCPDCAELVLAAALKCRYCGYRFDQASSSSDRSLVDLLRRPKSTTASLPELLSRWGTELAPEETVGYFGHCRFDTRAGYLLITTDRVAFFAGRGQERVIDWPRAAVSATLKRRTLRGAQLRLEAPGGAAATLDGFASRQTPDEVLAALAKAR